MPDKAVSGLRVWGFSYVLLVKISLLAAKLHIKIWGRKQIENQ